MEKDPQYGTILEIFEKSLDTAIETYASVNITPTKEELRKNIERMLGSDGQIEVLRLMHIEDLEYFEAILEKADTKSESKIEMRENVYGLARAFILLGKAEAANIAIAHSMMYTKDIVDEAIDNQDPELSRAIAETELEEMNHLQFLYQNSGSVYEVLKDTLSLYSEGRDIEYDLRILESRSEELLGRMEDNILKEIMKMSVS